MAILFFHLVHCMHLLNVERLKGKKKGFYFKMSCLHILGKLPRDVSCWKCTEMGFVRQKALLDF